MTGVLTGLQQLILISGYPSSGKTHRSKQLVDFFNAKIRSSLEPRISRLSVSHIDDLSLGLHRDVYREARTEKDARAAEYSAVKRVLGRDSIVIADFLNYIKGFRYQLYCEAKAVQTPSCVVSFNCHFKIDFSSGIEDIRSISQNSQLCSRADNLRGTCRNTNKEMSRDQRSAF